MSKLSDILRGEAAEEAAEDAIARRMEAEKKANALDQKGIELLKEQAELEDQIGRTDDDAKAIKLKARVDEIKSLREVNNQRKRVAAEELAKAQDDLRRARTGNRVKVVKKHVKDRATAAAKLDEALALYNEAWASFHKSSHALMLFAGGELLASARGGYGGMMLNEAEIEDAVSRELARLSSVGLLEHAMTPQLPGARVNLPGGNPKSFKPLREVIEQANTYIMSVAEQMPLPTPKVEKPQVEQSKADPDDKLLEVPAQPTQTFRADQIIMPRKRMA